MPSTFSTLVLRVIWLSAIIEEALAINRVGSPRKIYRYALQLGDQVVSSQDRKNPWGAPMTEERVDWLTAAVVGVWPDGRRRAA